MMHVLEKTIHPEQYAMKTYRTHGDRPIEIVAVHGGPEDLGGMVQLAVTLSDRYGVLEPFQTS
jgi:hypothetical protein